MHLFFCCAHEIYQGLSYQGRDTSSTSLLEKLMSDAINRLEQALNKHRQWAALRKVAAPNADNSENENFVRLDIRDVEAVLAAAIAALRKDEIRLGTLEHDHYVYSQGEDCGKANMPTERRQISH
jgi:hypothetical protein